MADEQLDQLRWGISRLADHSYVGGLNGTCHGCPFASPPLHVDGTEAPYGEIANDPTEAFFRCSLPTRAEEHRLSWGEYAPCTVEEWTGWLGVEFAGLAGRLVPDGAEIVEQWEAWCHAGDSDGIVLSSRYAEPSRERAQEWGRQQIGRYGITRFTVVRRECHRWPDGTDLTTPWVAVPESVEEQP